MIPFTLDAQRILLNIAFVRPDDGLRRALAWFNMGMTAPVLSKSLYNELQIDRSRGRSVSVRIGTTDIAVAPATFVDGDGKIDGESELAHYFSPYPVEAILHSGLLQKLVVSIDYDRHALALSAPGTARAKGIAVPFRLNTATGVAVLDANIDGKVYPFVLDAGSGYTWIRGEVMTAWLQAHPEWQRTTGAVGQANNAMVDYDFEKAGRVARLPEMGIGSVKLTEVGIFGTGPLLGQLGDRLVGDLLWDKWEKSAPGPIIGWIGGNVLRQFRLTIDYPNRMTYWQRQRPSDPHDLDGVGITLVKRSGHYFVGAIVRQTRPGIDPADAIPGIDVGDELISVDGVKVRDTTKETVLVALHGMPGETRRLVLERGGHTTEVDAKVSSFE